MASRAKVRRQRAAPSRAEPDTALKQTTRTVETVKVETRRPSGAEKRYGNSSRRGAGLFAYLGSLPGGQPTNKATAREQLHGPAASSHHLSQDLLGRVRNQRKEKRRYEDGTSCNWGGGGGGGDDGIGWLGVRT